MVKRISCRVVSSTFSGQHQVHGNRRPPMQPSDFSGPLGEVNVDGEQDCFPMGMFIDIIIGD